MSKTQKFLSHRGDIKALVGHGKNLYFTTIHAEEQATALYSFNVDDETVEAIPLDGGSGKVLGVAGDSVFIANVEDGLERYRFGAKATEAFGPSLGGSITAITSAANDSLAVLAGTSLVILSLKDGTEKQHFDLQEDCSSLASNENGQWIVVGTTGGTLAVFESENKDAFVKGDAQKLHEGSVGAVLFDKEELRAYSTGTDCKLLLTHVRGRLDPEDRGGKSRHDQPITAMITGPANNFYTGSTDKTFKIWPGGLTKKRPSTTKDGVGAVVSMALVEHKGRNHFAVAASDSTIRLWDLEENGRPKERVALFKGAMARARHELTQSDRERRQAALQELASYNDAPSIEVLSERAKSDDDYALRVLSSKLLGETANPRARIVLEQLLSSKDEGVRVEALNGLRSLEGKTALRPLKLALAVGREDIGSKAVEVLESLAKTNDEALQELIKSLNIEPSEVRARALFSLEKVFGNKDIVDAALLGCRSNKADIRRLSLIRFFQNKNLGDTRVQAALRRHGEDEAGDVRQAAFLVSVLSRPKLTQALRERDADLHRKFVEFETFGQELEDHDNEAPSEITVQSHELDSADQRPLLQAMASRSLDTCSRGATALALLQDSRAFGTLLQLSRESNVGTRVEVSKALENLADPRGIARLRLMIRDKEAGVRDAAFSALVRLEQADPLQAARAGSTADHEDIRRRALQLLLQNIKETMPQSKDDLSWRLLSRALNDSFPEVRSEAFKASLNLEFAGGGESTLRFALESLHKDIRNEVFVEIMAQMNETWAWPLLLELFQDPDSGIRSEAFKFASKKAKSRLVEMLSAALDSTYGDVRAQATKSLDSCKEEGAEALLFRALDDDLEKVRRLGLEALLKTNSPAISRVMKSKYPDVRARAAHARALEGDEEALIPLLNLVSEEKPDISDHQRTWLDRVKLALEGLSELGSPGALDTLGPLLKSDDASIRRGAAVALAHSSRPGNTKFLLEALRHSDESVRMEAALGLAACGDTTGFPVIFGDKKSSKASPSLALRASLALGSKAENYLLSFLDHSNDAIRSNAFLSLMLIEFFDPAEGTPSRCLAGLSAENPDIRMKAASALENYSNTESFGNYVVELFNDRGEDKAWTIDRDVISSIGRIFAHGNSVLCYRASSLLSSLKEKKQDTFDTNWKRFERRFSNDLKELNAGQDSRSKSLALGEIHRLVFGTYVGLSRHQGGNAAVPIRVNALKRLFQLGKADPSLTESIHPVLVLALGDSNQNVRKFAFECLAELTTDVQALCAEALSSGQRDVGALGFQKLVAEGDTDTSRELLERVLKNNTDDLEFEAAKILAKQVGEVETAQMSFEARSEKLRKDSVLKLAKNYEDAKSAEALRSSLSSRYRDVRIVAAMELAAKKDNAAFDILKELLTNDQKSEQRQAINGLKKLGDGRSSALFLDRLDNDPAGTALHKELFAAVGESRDSSVTDRLLAAIRKNKHRQLAFNAVYKISGYDQTTGDELVDPDWEKDQHPRNPAVLAQLMEVCYRASDENKLSTLIPAARWCRTNAVDQSLATLAFYPRENVRRAAVESLGWRSRERNGDSKALEKALQHDDEITRFLAAEGLALGGRGEGLTVLQTSVELLTDLDHRRRAVKALGKLGDQQALDLLLRIINEDGHALQEEAAEALGHMRESDQADKVFKTLSTLAAGSYGVALSAMTGLRWFGTMDAWAILRARIADHSWMVRDRICELLANDPDDKARGLLRKRIEEDDDSDVVETAVKSLRKICEEGSLEPDYALICCEHSYLISDALERLKEKGDPAALLEILPKVNEDYFDNVVEALLSRSPLPLEAAAKALEESSRERTLRVASQILGRAGEGAKQYGASLVKACVRWEQKWRSERARISDGDRQLHEKMSDLTDSYCLMLWSCGRLETGAEALIAATDPYFFARIRVAALTGLSAGIGAGEGIEALAKAVTDADATIRSLAASALEKLDSQRAGSLVAQALDDRTTLNRLIGADTTESREALRKAASTVHHQGVALPHLVSRIDIEGLAGAVNDSGLSETTRLGAIEGLARIASMESEKVIVGFASNESEDEDLRKAAWRALRRSKRYRKRQQALAEQNEEN